MSVGDFAKTSLCVIKRSLKFEARVGDKLASWCVVRNRTRRCSGTSESAVSGPESGTLSDSIPIKQENFLLQIREY